MSGRRSGSRRSLFSSYRQQLQFQKARTAMAFESSSLRYINLLAATEGTLERGWDDDVIISDDDGT